MCLMNHILTFILSLYGDPNLPRKIVDVTINFILDFLINVFVPSLKADILAVLKNENISNSALFDINECFDRHSKIFDYFETEAKRFNLLRQRGFIDFKKFPIGITFDEKIVDNEIIMSPETVDGVYIPLRESLKCFLEIPGLFNKIMEYVEYLKVDSNIITNIMQGNLWKNKYFNKFCNDIVLPIYIFF